MKAKISIEIRDYKGLIKAHHIETLEEGDEISIWFKKINKEGTKP